MHKQNSHFLLLTLLFALMILVVSGCSQPEGHEEEPKSQEGPQPLLIGLIPEQNLFAQKKRYEPLLAFLSSQLDRPIEVHILPRYGNIIENFNALKLDGAFFGSFTGALAIKMLGVEPVARPRYADGASTYYGMVFVRKGSGIRTAEDMRGKRMVFVDRATTAGYLLPLSYFHSIGIHDFRQWFSEYYFSGTHEDAIYDVLNGKAEVGAAKNTVLYRLAAKDIRVAQNLEILATSPHVPANGLAVRHDLPDEIKEALQSILLELHQNAAGQAILEGLGMERFIETTAGDYQPVFEYAASIGLDLGTYDYLNN